MEISYIAISLGIDFENFEFCNGKALSHSLSFIPTKMSRRPVRFSAEKALQRLLKDTDSDSDADDSDNDNITNTSASVYNDGDNQRNINDSDDSDQENNGQSDDEEDALNDEEDDNLLPEANTVPSNTYISKDGTSWSRILVNMRSGRLPSCNVLRRRGESTRFIENRVDTEVDVFDELFGPQTIEDIVSYANDEAQRQLDTNLSI